MLRCVFAVGRNVVNKAVFQLFCRLVGEALFTAAFDGILISECLLIEVHEHMRRIHEDCQSTDQRYDSVDVQ